MISGICHQVVERTRGVPQCRIVRSLAIGFIVILLELSSVFPEKAQHVAGGRSVARSYFTSAQKALAAGDSTTAIEKLNQAIQADSNYAEAYLLLGLTEFQRGQTAKSIEHYKRALQLQPGSYSGHYNLALAYLRDHKLEEGRAQLEQAVKLDPNQPDAAYDLGVVLLEQGHPAQALSYLTRVRKLNPRRPDVAFNIVRAELEAGRVVEARTEARAAAGRLGSDPQWNAAIGALFLKNAQPKDAAANLREANASHPENVEVRHQLALAYLQSGQPGQVLELIAEPKTDDDHYLRGSAISITDSRRLTGNRKRRSR